MGAKEYEPLTKREADFITAFVIYFVVAALLTGFSGGVLLMSLAVGGATLVVAWIVTTLMARRGKG